MIPLTAHRRGSGKLEPGHQMRPHPTSLLVTSQEQSLAFGEENQPAAHQTLIRSDETLMMR